MNPSLSVSPTSVAPGGTAVVTVTPPPAETLPISLIRRSDGAELGRVDLTIQHDQITVGLESDTSTQYFVRAPGLTLQQVSALKFNATAP